LASNTIVGLPSVKSYVAISSSSEQAGSDIVVLEFEYSERCAIHFPQFNAAVFIAEDYMSFGSHGILHGPSCMRRGIQRKPWIASIRFDRSFMAIFRFYSSLCKVYYPRAIFLRFESTNRRPL